MLVGANAALCGEFCRLDDQLQVKLETHNEASTLSGLIELAIHED